MCLASVWGKENNKKYLQTVTVFKVSLSPFLTHIWLLEETFRKSQSGTADIYCLASYRLSVGHSIFLFEA